MNEITLLREGGPEAPLLSPAVRASARAALMAEIDSSSAHPRRLRLPSRTVSLRIGLAVATAAAAWTAAVVIAAPDGPGAPAGSVTLVDFEMPTFPLSLDPEPDELTPAFDGDGDGASIASYHDADHLEGFTVVVTDDEPERLDETDDYRVGDVHEVEVDGRDAELVHGSQTWCPGPEGDLRCTRRGFTELVWERRDGQWVRIEGHGSYDDTARLLEVAGSLVDRPQPATLDVGLAPAGWSVQFFKMGRVLTLVNDAYEQQTVTVHVPLPEEVLPLEQVRENLMGPVGPQLAVTVQGRPGALVRVDNGPVDRGWFLQAQSADGTTFTLQVPDAFTQEQVLQFAEQVTHRP
jgi:hypothetical protein